MSRLITSRHVKSHSNRRAHQRSLFVSSTPTRKASTAATTATSSTEVRWLLLLLLWRWPLLRPGLVRSVRWSVLDGGWLLVLGRLLWTGELGLLRIVCLRSEVRVVVLGRQRSRVRRAMLLRMALLEMLLRRSLMVDLRLAMLLPLLGRRVAGLAVKRTLGTRLRTNVGRRRLLAILDARHALLLRRALGDIVSVCLRSTVEASSTSSITPSRSAAAATRLRVCYRWLIAVRGIVRVVRSRLVVPRRRRRRREAVLWSGHGDGGRRWLTGSVQHLVDVVGIDKRRRGAPACRSAKTLTQCETVPIGIERCHSCRG